MADSAKEKVFLVQHLYLMVKGGFLVSEAIEVLKEELKSKQLKKAMDDVLKRILTGESLYKSLSHHPGIFNPFYQNIIKVGEESGSLESNLEYLAEQIQADYDMRKKIRGAMAYPLIVITLALLLAFSVTIFILPKLLNIFTILDVKLPLSTVILIASVSFVQKYWLFLIIGIFLIVIIIKSLRRVPFFRYQFDKIILSLPIFGMLTKNIILSRFAQSYFTLLKSGLPTLESLEIITETISNEVFKRNMATLKLEVEKGGKISTTLKSLKSTFPVVFSQMVSVGEKSGSLENSFQYLAKFYQKEVDTSLKTMTEILEPVLLVVVGLFVAFIALSIILPIYQFSGSLKLR